MADEEEGRWTWPTWGPRPLAEGWIKALEPDLDQEVDSIEGGLAEEQLVAPVDGQDEAAVEQEVEGKGVVVVKEEAMVEQDVEGTRVEACRGNTDGGARSKPAVPMENEGRGPRPARPRGRRPTGAGDLGWKAIRERPHRPRGGGWRSSSPACCGDAIGSGRRELV